jgi:hypothetical protein
MKKQRSSLKTKLKNFWLKLESFSNTGKVVLVFSLLLSMAMCSQAGWIGYYAIKTPQGLWNKVGYNTDNGLVLDFPKGQELWLEFPKNCSGFIFAGIITPFTPPIPIPDFRAISFGKNNPCNFFIVKSKPSTSIKLKLNNPKTNQPQIYEPKTSEALYGYTRHTFPIKSKNIDSGILIIEKDGEKIEVPFEYKYAKFWH